MCAINGFTFSDKELIQRMNNVTAHRGPDDTGVFLDSNISLGHNRLSIIDLSREANQPMKSGDDNLVITFNGEIYNFAELKRELVGDYDFKTKSDTEVILAAYKRWGEDCVKKFNGLFALAIWNKKDKTLFLARDHVGVKPLYYFWDGKNFIFSSEIKGILEHDIPRKISLEAMGHYFRLLYTPEPFTMFENIYKFPPAHHATLKDGKLNIKSYWDSKINKEKLSLKDAIRETKENVEESVKRQLVSDKPVGVYLSGGIDSSILLHNMSKLHKNIDTFSVGFELADGEQSEKFNADFLLARKTAQHYGTKHHEVLVSPNDVIDLFEKSVWHSDEPISNPTALSRFKISGIAKKNVDVVLSGDGGDELFGGYERYRLSLACDIWQKFVPSIVRRALSFNSAVRKLNTERGVDRYGLFMFQKDKILKEVLKERYVNDKTHKYFKDRYFSEDTSKSFDDSFMRVDRKTWLVDESLTLSDKMSMANGIEQRVPLLDPQIVEFSDTVPTKYKIGLFQKKILLREAFKNELPNYLFNQPKRGWFSPSAKWLRYPHIYKFAKEVLSPNYYEGTRDLFKWDNIENILSDHNKKSRYNLTVLWALITFQLWAKRFNVET